MGVKAKGRWYHLAGAPALECFEAVAWRVAKVVAVLAEVPAPVLELDAGALPRAAADAAFGLEGWPCSLLDPAAPRPAAVAFFAALTRAL